MKDDEECVSHDVQSLFTNIPLKETIDYILEQIYIHNKLPTKCSKLIFRRSREKITTEKGICSCESTYVGETKWNVEVRYSERNYPSGKSEPSKHLNQNINYMFTWSVICSAPKIDRTRQNLEAFYITIMRPNLNEQCDSIVLTAFRNDIT